MKNTEMRWQPIVSASFFLILSLVFLRVSWIADDAAISIRSIYNFLNGYGPVFNVGERAQAFTHTLWFFIVSIVGLIVGNVFIAIFAISIFLSIFFIFLILNIGKSDRFLLLALVATTISSKAFMDFTSSGLENPLSHILLFLHFFMIKNWLDENHNGLENFRYTVLLGISSSALVLTRPDFVIFLFAAFVCIVVFSNNPLRGFSRFLLGLSPLFAWLFFSFFYYGSLIPNSALAKLNNGILRSDLFSQGIVYIFDSAQNDQITLSTILIAVVFALGFRSRFMGLVSASILLYMLYIVYVGGDFMSGRFLTPPFAVAISALALQKLSGRYRMLILVLPLLGVSNWSSNFLTGPAYSGGINQETGIADERGFYFPNRSIFTIDLANLPQLRDWRYVPDDRSVTVTCWLGYRSLYYGPSVHIIDPCALSDPLLSRITPQQVEDWRIGHFYRDVPNGYIERIADSSIPIENNQEPDLFDDVQLVVGGDSIFEIERIKAILRLNFLQYEVDGNYMNNVFIFSRAQMFSEEALDFDETGYMILTNEAVALARSASQNLQLAISPTSNNTPQQYTVQDALQQLRDGLILFSNAIDIGLPLEYANIAAGEIDASMSLFFQAGILRNTSSDEVE